MTEAEGKFLLRLWKEGKHKDHEIAKRLIYEDRYNDTLLTAREDEFGLDNVLRVGMELLSVWAADSKGKGKNNGDS